MNDCFILIAEDDADDRYLVQTVFEENKFDEKIHFVENGVELMGFLENIRRKKVDTQHFPSFILLDLNMPKKDGREALKELKQHPVFKRIPVVVFTTTQNDKEIIRCYELGANTYVVKPTGYDALANILKEIRRYWIETATFPLSPE